MAKDKDKNMKAPESTTIRIDITGERPKTRYAEEQANDLNSYLHNAVEAVLNAADPHSFDWKGMSVEEIDPSEDTQLQTKFAAVRKLAGDILLVIDDLHLVETTIHLDGLKFPKPIHPDDVEPKAERHQKGWLYQVNLPVTIRTRKDRKYCARKCGGYKTGKLAKTNSVPYCGYFECTVEDDRRCLSCLSKTGDN